METGDFLLLAGSIGGAVLVSAVVAFLGARLKRAVEVVSDGIRESSTTMADRLSGQIDESMDRAVNRMSQIADEMSAAANDSAQKQQEVVGHFASIANDYRQLSGALETTVDGLSMVLNTVQDFDGLRRWEEALSTASEPMTRIAEDLQAFREHDRALIGEVSGLLTQWAEQHQRVEQLYKDATNNLADWQVEESLKSREDSEVLRNQIQHIAENYELTRRTIGHLNDIIDKDSQIREELQNSLNPLVVRLGEVTGMLGEIQQAQAEVIQTLTQVSEPIAEAAKNLNTDLTQASREIRVEMTGTAKSIREDFSQVLADIGTQTREQAVVQEQVNGAMVATGREVKESISAFGRTLRGALPKPIFAYVQTALLVGVIAVVVVSLIIQQ